MGRTPVLPPRRDRHLMLYGGGGMAVAQSGARPIHSSEARRICALTGVQGKLYADKLVEYRDLEQMLLVSQKDLERARTRDQILGYSIVALRIVKLACDVTIGVVADRAGPGGTAVSMVYDRAGLVVDAFNHKLDVREIVEFIIGVHVGVAGQTLTALGKDKAAGVLGKAALLYSASRSVAEITDDLQSLTFGSSLDGSRSTLVAQLQKVRARIADLEAELKACGLA